MPTLEAHFTRKYLRIMRPELHQIMKGHGQIIVQKLQINQIYSLHGHREQTTIN